MLKNTCKAKMLDTLKDKLKYFVVPDIRKRQLGNIFRNGIRFMCLGLKHAPIYMLKICGSRFTEVYKTKNK